MKTTHDISKGSEARPVWWCYLIWWLEALALLVIMITISVCRALQERRPQVLEDRHDDAEDLGFTGVPSTA